MKIIKIFGIVAGIHLFALILIFANPGCSSTAKSSAEKSGPDTASTSSQPPLISPTSDNVAPTPIVDNGSQPPSDMGVRFSPTRPNTPASTALEAKPVADVTPATTYTVVKGDSLWTIAKKNKTTVAELKAANNIKDSSLHLGQKLLIPGKAGAPAAATQTAAAAPTTKPAADAPATKEAAAGSVKHTVKAGESLGMIARKYHVKQGDIATANNISDPKMIRVGQELIIPAAKGTTTKASSTASTKTPAAANDASAPAASSEAASAGPAATTPPTNTTPTIVISDTPTVGPSSGPATAMPSGSPSTEPPPVIQIQETPHN